MQASAALDHEEHNRNPGQHGGMVYCMARSARQLPNLHTQLHNNCTTIAHCATHLAIIGMEPDRPVTPSRHVAQ